MILQLIDKAGDFVSDDIWFRVVQFVTNNEDLQVIIAFPALDLMHNNYGIIDLVDFIQPYAAVKAREYLDKPAIHETMVKVCTKYASHFNACFISSNEYSILH